MDKPEIGSLATYSLGTDRYPYTVIAVSKSGHRVTLQARRTRRVDSNGASEEQRWISVEDPTGRTMIATRRKDGAYRAAGCANYGRVRFDGADCYLDPSF